MSMLHCNDPTGEIGAAWGVKERLRMLLKEHEPSKIRWRLADFYDAALDAAMPETTRLAKTIETWWPAILVALTHDVSNARTEGFNRIIKADQAGRLRLPEHDQLSTSYPQPHRGHPTAEISSMNGTKPRLSLKSPLTVPAFGRV